MIFSVAGCLPGTYAVSDERRCAWCPVGSYRPEDAPVGRCLPCPPGRIVSNNGLPATSENSCTSKVFLPFGHSER